LILDPEGQKMSKSRGNVVEPADVIDRHGADAFRWYYFTSQQPWAGYRFSTDTVGEAVRQFLLTLWNTYSFWVLYANADDLGPEDFRRGAHPHPGTDTHAAHATSLDRWAVSRLQHTVERVRERLDDFDSTTSGQAIAAYIEELSNWYVRLSRRRFWEGDRNAFATLRWCLVETAKLLAPFTPFLADEIYCNLVGGASGDFEDAPDSVHLCDFPRPHAELVDDALEAGMEAVRRTVELGRAARAQAKVKVRQPLRRAVIVATEAERAAIEAQSDLVTSELNVKQLEFVSERSELVTYRVRPDYRKLGPRFGKQMPQVAAAIEALDAAHVAEAIEAGREVGVSVEGKDHTLSGDEVSLVMEPLEGYQVEAEAGHAVALELELDEELRREGLAREIVHAIQNARKGAGLDIADRIELRLGGDDELLEVAREHESYIAGETLATEVSYDGAGPDSIAATIEGRSLSIGVARAG
jgi:isoleucyl-tRNA synthetase